jgi:hypothetical protein
LEGLGIDRIMLQLILKEEGWEDMWARFNWLRLGISGVVL